MATKKKAGTRTPVKRKYIDNKTAVDKGVKCPSCGERYGHKITNTYPNGNRRRICAGCNTPFVSLRVLES